MTHTQTRILWASILVITAAITAFLPQLCRSSELGTHSFPSIYGGRIDTKQWQGKPYLVVNTASQCAFTKQYADLQKLYDTYRDSGFGIIAIPSDDFNQEFDSNAEIKSFCALNYDIDMPMSETLAVTGAQAHPFFKAVRAQSGFTPRWNFNKILIGSNGQVLATWGASTRPLSQKLTHAIDAELDKHR
ncbi:glutathione peroxidase [uncultured Planktomarina sp.]|uniref:glutathione peroxidase n=1 Tax=uncultured Planktomarina sp. TaxID=1538529 RepID=UPI003261CE76